MLNIGILLVVVVEDECGMEVGVVMEWLLFVGVMVVIIRCYGLCVLEYFGVIG